MNTDNFNNNQQQLFEEPAFIDGVAGKKELPAEPQFISGEINRNENLTPLYADQTRPDPYHAHPGFNNEFKAPLPLYGEEQKPIYADQVSGKNKLYPGQENFVGQQMNAVNGKEVLTSGGVVQAAYVPPNHGEELKREDRTEHFNITRENQDVQLPPEIEHLHITTEPVVGGNVEQVIRIKPDGRVTVATEKIVEEEHRKKEVKVEKEHEHEHEHKKTKKDTKKKKHVEKVKHEAPEETTTVVRVIEHEGTGHPNEKLGKHDETLTHKHSKKDHSDSHSDDGTKVKVNKEHHEVTHKHGKKEHSDSHSDDGTKVKVNKEHHEVTHKHGKKEHADTHNDDDGTKVKVNKEHHTKTNKHGKKEHVDKHKTKVKVNNKEHHGVHVPFVLAKHTEEIDSTGEHGKTSGKKRSSGNKDKGDKSETTTEVKETKHEPGTEGHDKTVKTEKTEKTEKPEKESKLHHLLHHHDDEKKVKVEKEEHQHTI